MSLLKDPLEATIEVCIWLTIRLDGTPKLKVEFASIVSISDALRQEAR